jgi:hypothetical protein
VFAELTLISVEIAWTNGFAFTSDQELKDSTATDAVTYLVEPLRSQATVKWSGTMSHTGNNVDFVSQTIYAFTHYVYEESEHKLVMADMQGGSEGPKVCFLPY